MWDSVEVESDIGIPTSFEGMRKRRKIRGRYVAFQINVHWFMVRYRIVGGQVLW
jgi:ribosomal protein S6E (S10)